MSAQRPAWSCPQDTLLAAVRAVADGRYSTVREIADIEFEKNTLVRDFLWMKVTAPLGMGFRALSRAHQSR